MEFNFNYIQLNFDKPDDNHYSYNGFKYAFTKTDFIQELENVLHIDNFSKHYYINMLNVNLELSTFNVEEDFDWSLPKSINIIPSSKTTITVSTLVFNDNNSLRTYIISEADIRSIKLAQIIK